jgi:hypothetical protein
MASNLMASQLTGFPVKRMENNRMWTSTLVEQMESHPRCIALEPGSMMASNGNISKGQKVGVWIKVLALGFRTSTRKQHKKQCCTA